MNLHFNISEETEDLFNDYVKKATAGKDHINITYSFQKKKTDTVVVDMENNLFILENRKVLHRLLRVYGVVKNEGGPGGGPYIVDNGNYFGLQNCEASEINMKDERQGEILNASKYFSPVDLVCFVKDHEAINLIY